MEWLDNRDSAHNHGIMGIACWLKKNDQEAIKYMQPVNDVLFKSMLWPIKNPDYSWSNSGSENPTENTFAKRPTYWLYWHILKYFKCDPYKGTNPDQCQPVITFYCLTGLFGYKPLAKILTGLVLRLGFFPNGEHLIFKLPILAPIARAWHLWPVYWLLDLLELIGSLFDYSTKKTTTKIRLYLYLLQAEDQWTLWTYIIKWYYSREITLEQYFKAAYFIYFGENHIIYKTMKYDVLKEVR